MPVKKPLKPVRPTKKKKAAPTRKASPRSSRKAVAANPETAAPSPDIRWGWAAGGLGACFVIIKFVLPYSAFFGFLSLGVATLVVGYALGRD